MIVCHCAGVTDRDIANLVAEGATTVRDVIRRCGAGRSCGPCRAELEEMISAACAGCPARAAA
jgi:bacterioferritin-associated ferredoxin